MIAPSRPSINCWQSIAVAAHILRTKLTLHVCTVWRWIVLITNKIEFMWKPLKTIFNSLIQAKIIFNGFSISANGNCRFNLRPCSLDDTCVSHKAHQSHFPNYIALMMMARADEWKLSRIDVDWIGWSENLNYHYDYHIDLCKVPIYRYRYLKIHEGWKIGKIFVKIFG